MGKLAVFTLACQPVLHWLWHLVVLQHGSLPSNGFAEVAFTTQAANMLQC